jgi:hypothetical protein
LAGYPHMFEGMYGAGEGYADFGDPQSYAMQGPTHVSFIVWLIVLVGGATALLGGLKVWGFHFVVKT